MATFHSKGKSRDQSTPWSAWTWDSRGYHFASRYGPTGEIEYDYRYPVLFPNPEVPRSSTDSTYDYSGVLSLPFYPSLKSI